MKRLSSELIEESVARHTVHHESAIDVHLLQDDLQVSYTVLRPRALRTPSQSSVNIGGARRERTKQETKIEPNRIHTSESQGKNRLQWLNHFLRRS